MMVDDLMVVQDLPTYLRSIWVLQLGIELSRKSLWGIP